MLILNSLIFNSIVFVFIFTFLSVEVVSIVYERELLLNKLG